MRHKYKQLFLACALILQGCGDGADKSGEYLDSAKTYYAQENYSKAKLELRNALQINDNLSEAYYYLGLVHEQEKNWKEMYDALSRTVQLDPSNDVARTKLAKLYLLSNEKEQAKAEVGLLSETSKNTPDIYALNGAILLKEGKTTAALAEANKALAIDPSHVDAVGLIVGVYTAQEEYAAAEKQISVAIAGNPNELAFYLLKLKVHLKTRSPALVEQDYQQIIKQFPEKLDFSYALAKFYTDRQQVAKGSSLLQKTVNENNSLIQPKLVLVDFLLQQDINNAEATINRFIQENPSEADFYFKRANLLILQNKVNEAKEPLNWVITHNQSEDKNVVQAKVALAKLALGTGDSAEAIRLSEEVLVSDKRNYDALLLKARISLSNGQYDHAISDLRSTLRDYSRSDEALTLLGQALMRKGSPELAEESFRKALEINPSNFSAVMPVVTRMVNSHDIGRAEGLLQAVLDSDPYHKGAMEALAQVKLLRNDVEGSEKMLTALSSQSKDQSFSNFLRGKIAQSKGRFPEAIEKYQVVLTKKPELMAALTNMSDCYESLGQRHKMQVYLDDFMVKNPSLPYPLILKSKLFGLDNDWEKTIAMLNKGIARWPQDPQFYRYTANVYIAKKEIDKAIATYNAGLQKIPNDVTLRLSLASTYEIKKDFDTAIKMYEGVVATNPESDVATNNLVSLLLDFLPSKENFERSVELTKRFESSPQPYYMDSYGWALLKNGNASEAVTILERVNLKTSRVAVFNYHLGAAYYELGDKANADRLLRKSLDLGTLQQGEFIEKAQVNILLEKIAAETAETVMQ
ncbi:MAG: tetratricopeptide repeat protein [Methylococcales bacterium]|nr:tetratricopeptide repeat protein [Methylococcales bacterium]